MVSPYKIDWIDACLKQESINKMPERVDFVMKKFMQIIPETETNLRSKISNYLENNIWNKAPEILNGYDIWMDLFNILKYNIGEMDAEWKQEILKIYNAAVSTGNPE